MAAEAAIASPPPTAAPAAPASPPPAAPNAAPAIHVTPPPAGSDPGPVAEAKPGSAKDRLFGELRKKADSRQEAEAAKPAVAKAETKVEEGDPEPAPDGEAAPAAPAAGDKKTKVSPWKLVDEHKAARLKAETELAELRKTIVDPNKFKELETKAEAAERRAKELDEEIKFHDYRKSSEFAEKYQKPYEEAWKKHMADLGELTVTDPATGNDRPLAPQDLLELVNLPLKEAKAKAMETFGDFADEVMGARKEIRSLFEAQTKALEDARKTGGERQAQMKAQQQQLGNQIGEMWKQANDLVLKDEKVGKYFQPVEGDEEANTRLKKGYEIADQAFSKSPLDPSLTPEQRQEVVRLHSAVRNRAAAFGRLTYQNERLTTEITALRAELAKYKELQPGAGEGKGAAPEGHTSAHDSVFAALRKYAH